MEQTCPSWIPNALEEDAAGWECKPLFFEFLVDFAAAAVASLSLSSSPNTTIAAASVILIVLPISRATVPTTKAQAADNFMMMDDG